MLGIRSTRGDTIVEVMISLAVLSFIIVGAYSIASRSLNATRVAQERGEATKIAEGQLEAIRDYFKSDRTKAEIVADGYYGLNDDATAMALTGSSLTDESGFCVTYTVGLLPKEVESNHMNGVSLGAAESSDSASYACTVNAFYKIYITTTYVEYSAGDPLSPTLLKRLTYSVNVFWDRAGGGGKENLAIQDRFTYEN